MPYYDRDPKKDHSFDNHPVGPLGPDGELEFGGHLAGFL